MSDDESFVILGNSPTPSFTQEDDGAFRSIDQSAKELMRLELPRSEQIWSLNNSPIQASVEATSSSGQHTDDTANCGKNENNIETDGSELSQSSKQQKSTIVGCEPTKSEKKLWSLNSSGRHKTDEESLGKSNSSLKNDNMNGNAGLLKLDANTNHGSGTSAKSSAGTTSKGSLAASFILGETDADVLKSAVYYQFPGLAEMESRAEAVVKMGNLVSEYVNLKSTLTKVNGVMEEFYEKTRQWKDAVQNTEAKYKLQIEGLQDQILCLRLKNKELSIDLNEKIKEITDTDSLRRKDYDELAKSVLERNDIIENMRLRIAKLEEQMSLEGIPKNVKDSKQTSDYVYRVEHENIVKDFQRELSELLATNLNLHDVQKRYIEEINSLKLNLASAEEIMKQHKSEINFLKEQNVKYVEEFEKFKSERNEIKGKLELLTQQLEVYKHDFDIERASRQNLAGEKDQLLRDLRILQRKNHELIEEAQQQYEIMEKQRRDTATARPLNQVSPSPTIENAKCPICLRTCNDIAILRSHVHFCLEKKFRRLQ